MNLPMLDFEREIGPESSFDIEVRTEIGSPRMSDSAL